GEAEGEFLSTVGGQIAIFLERLSTARALDSAEAQFRMLAQAASVGVFTIDEASTILFANDAVEKIFGYHAEELIGGKLTVVMPEYLRHVHEHALSHYVATGKKHVSWEGIALPGLHKDCHELNLIISFGEFVRQGKR